MTLTPGRPRRDERQLDRPAAVPAAQRVVPERRGGRVPDLRSRPGAAEIQSLTTAPGGSVGGGNVAWYRFDDADGPTAKDASGKNRHARVIAPTDGRRHAGFLSAYPETQFVRLEEFAAYGGNQGIWAPYYTLHKILAGLIDAHQLAGNTQALDIASKIADWVHSRLAPLPQAQLDRMWNTYIAGEYGGINDTLAQLAALRPDKPEYLTAAARFVNNARLPAGRRQQRHPRRPARQPAHPAVHRLPADVRAEQRGGVLHRREELLGHGGAAPHLQPRRRRRRRDPAGARRHRRVALLRTRRTTITPRPARSTTCSSSAGICSSTIPTRST